MDNIAGHDGETTADRGGIDDGGDQVLAATGCIEGKTLEYGLCDGGCKGEEEEEKREAALGDLDILGMEGSMGGKQEGEWDAPAF